MKVEIQRKMQGPVETQIMSNSYGHGAGYWNVIVSESGIELWPVGRPQIESRKFTFGDLELINVRELLIDCDCMMERYTDHQVEKIRQLEEKLTNLKAATARELSALGKRKGMKLAGRTH